MPASRPPFRLLLITDRTVVPAGRTLATQLRLALEGVDQPSDVAVLFRDKDLPDGPRAALGREVRTAVREGGAHFLVHGDVALAQRLGADGVHVADSIAARADLAKATKGWILGASCHDSAGLDAAASAGAHYATLSPMFPSPGKAEPGEELGISALAGPHPLPVVALGGVEPGVGRDAIAAGAWGLATIRAVLGASDPRTALRSLQECL